MNALLLFLVAWQTGWSVSPATYTVGDTVVLERRLVLADPGTRVRAAPLPDDDAYQPLRPPEVRYTADGAVVRYLVSAFDPRGASIVMPDLEQIRPDGTVDAVPGGEVRLAPGTVLPRAGDTLPAPRFSRAPIPRALRQTQPVLIAGTLAVVLVILWGMSRRRVGLRPTWGSGAVSPEDPPLTEWIQAGEPRAVAALAMTRFRAALAARVPEASDALSVEECLAVMTEERSWWPLAELRQVLATLERASFAPAVPSDVLVVVDEVDDILAVIDDADREHEAVLAAGDAEEA